MKANYILDAICLALKKEFDYTIYTNRVEQGLKQPCFFVLCLSPLKELFLGKRYKAKNLFSIQLLADTGNETLYEAADRLSDVLEYLSTEQGDIRASNFTSEITDGVLTYTVRYDFFLDRLGEEEKMEHIETNRKLG